MLNLRQAAYPSDDKETTQHHSTIRFKSSVFIGNLGESLDLGNNDEEGDMEGSDWLDTAGCNDSGEPDVKSKPGDVCTNDEVLTVDVSAA